MSRLTSLFLVDDLKKIKAVDWFVEDFNPIVVLYHRWFKLFLPKQFILKRVEKLSSQMAAATMSDDDLFIRKKLFKSLIKREKIMICANNYHGSSIKNPEFLKKMNAAGVSIRGCSNVKMINNEIRRIDFEINNINEKINAKKRTSSGEKIGIMEKIAGLSSFFKFRIPMEVSVYEMLAYQKTAERDIKEHKRQLFKEKRKIRK